MKDRNEERSRARGRAGQAGVTLGFGLLALALAGGAMGCSSGSSSEADPDGAEPEAVDTEGSEGDAGSEPSPEPEPGEVVEPDVGPVEPEPVEQCAVPEATIDASRQRFALSLFHFNVEYVVGGLEYVDEEGKTKTLAGLAAAEGWGNDEVEDWIVVETLEPVLDLYAEHAAWRTDIELQAYMVEVLAERHPAVLAKLRDLACSGQVELISFHYSAQLFLAFPREELTRSLVRTREIFEQHGLPLSGVVFNQEGQAGMGRQRVLVEEGYEVGVFPKNLWGYQRTDTPWPWYSSEGGTLIVGPGGVDPDSGVEVSWTFFDDGELLAVPIGPYLAPIATADEQSLADYAEKMAEREAEGFYVATIGEYVEHLEAAGVDKPEAPPLLDGTWQPPSTDSIHRWLGGRSDVNHQDEEDDLVRTGNAQARMYVAAAQVAVEHAQGEGLDTAAWEAALPGLWDRLFRTQISDSSGVNPWRAEVLHSLRLNEELLEESQALLAELKVALDAAVIAVDLEARSVEPLGGFPTQGPMATPEPPPLEVLVEHEGRSAGVQWFELNPQRFRLEILFSPADPDAEGDLRHIAALFPRHEDVIRYSPGLLDDEVHEHAFELFELTEGEVWLPLPNGLVGLGAKAGSSDPDAEGWWVIKHVRSTHVAARYAPASPHVDFVDDTIQVPTQTVWIFEVVQGTGEEALAIADRLNTRPVVYW